MSTSTRKAVEIPLLRFFLDLRAYDKQSLGRLGLGIDEYLLALETLDHGYGLEGADELFSICKALWFKPYHTEKAFRELFDKYLDEILQEIRLERARRQEEAPGAETSPQEERSAADDKDQEDRSEDQEEDQEKDLSEDQADQTDEKDEEEQKPGTPGQSASKEDAFRSIYLRLSSQGPGNSPANRTAELRKLREEIYNQNFVLRGAYFPLRSRKIQQSFQMIRRITFEGRKDTIDWPATIRHVARQGFFDNPVLMASPQIKSGLYILVDSGGSMLPFAGLTQTMVSALRTFVGKKTQVFFFRNCPVGFLYDNEEQTRAIDIASFGDNRPRSVLIVSDAGAARGGYNPDRVAKTRNFLERMKKHKVVWLNPMPEDRWQSTTADYIHSLVPMYELTEVGFVNAIKALKLKHRNRT